MSRALFPDSSVDDEHEMRAFRDRADAEVFVVERPGGMLAGYVEVGTRPYADGCSTSPVGYIEAWYADPDVRRTGQGRRLLAAAEEWAREQGYREVASDALLGNTVSHRAHISAGYAEVDRVVQFRKVLAPGAPSSALPDVRVEEFFASYRGAFERQDAPAIAAHFADPVHVASDTGGGVRLAVATTAEWLEIIERLLGMYRELHVGTARVVSLSSVALSSNLTQARLRWAVLDREGAPLYEFDALYTLATHGERFRIAAIAHDEIARQRRAVARPGRDGQPPGGQSR